MLRYVEAYTLYLYTRSVGRTSESWRLGDVLSNRASERAFEAVENSRTTAIENRTDGVVNSAVVAELLAEAFADDDTTRAVARAYTVYFEFGVVNPAEERERVRALRDGEREGTLGDTVSATVESLTEENVDAAELHAVVGDVDVVPTFTAHSAEARRKTVKGILSTLFEADVDPTVRGRIVANSPLGAFADPEDIANAIAFLSAPASDHVNGHEFRVEDGQVPVNDLRTGR